MAGVYAAIATPTTDNPNRGLSMTEPDDRLCVLANSLPAAIRWRFCDYEQLLRKQLQLLAPPLRLVWPPRDTEELRTK